MTYRTSKKIYPGDMTEPLNGWYQNISIYGQDSLNASNAGPTSVLANPGWRFFQMRGYVAVTNTSGDGYVQSAQVIIPSPYKNDPTRVNITGMVISGDADRPAYVYRTAISVASGWNDGRVVPDRIITENAGQIIGFGPGSNLTTPINTSGTVEGANLSGVASGIPVGSFGLGTNPLPSATGVLTSGDIYKEYTTGQQYYVFAKATTNGTALDGGWAISDADFAAGNTGYIVVEVCFIQPDVAVEYSDIEQYLPYKTEGLKPGQYGN